MRKFMVTIEGKQYEVGVEEIGATGTQTVQPVQVAKEVAPQKATSKVVSGNGTKMACPMPGMIKAFKVSEGASVKKGDVVIVLEAMKMDNDLTAPCDGVISFKTSVGSNVETGDVMAVIA